MGRTEKDGGKQKTKVDAYIRKEIVMDNCFMILANEAKSAAESNGGSIVDRFKEAMKVTKSHWLVIDEDSRLRGAIAGVMMSYDKGTIEYERIDKEVRMLNQFSAMIQAANVGLTVNPPDVDDDFEPIGFLNLWKEC